MVPAADGPLDAVRLTILERDRHFPVGDLFDRIDDGIARWERRAGVTTEEQGGFTGLHPRGRDDRGR